ncbi:MAG: hypothetical protein SV760_02770 [Halobacteria archaeon]|nr:hypothetical protein [Halobacteria archaeon]
MFNRFGVALLVMLVMSASSTTVAVSRYGFPSKPALAVLSAWSVLIIGYFLLGVRVSPSGR